MGYQKHFSVRKTPQSSPIPGREPEMVKNLAGGYAWPVDDWTRLEKFLILGSEGGTYYIGERKLTIQNAQAASRCLKEDGRRVVDLLAEISLAGRAPKNNGVLFVLAMATSPTFSADEAVRRYAFSKLPQIARTGSQLLQFIPYMEAFRGWGKLAREAIGNWYNSKAPDRLAFQVGKYQQRFGWSHQDLLRLAHPTPPSNEHNNLYRWIAGKELDEEDWIHAVPGILLAMEEAKQATQVSQITRLIRENNLPREMTPTNWFNEAAVWEALLERMPPWALIRNLGKMTQVGLLAPFSDGTKEVVKKLSDSQALIRARLHPWIVLNGAYWYGQGHGMLGKLTWDPVTAINDVLDSAFHGTFPSVEPTGKRVVICIDISGSMRGAQVTAAVTNRGSVKGMAAAQAAGALALITARTEPQYEILLFATQVQQAQGVQANSTIQSVTESIKRLIHNGTDYAAPIKFAADKKIPADIFVLFGDMESWYGSMHAAQAIQYYREKTGIAAKMVLVHMCSTSTTLADPNDAGIIELIGFDTSVPKLISYFAE